jgi:ribosome-associated protein
MEFWKTVPSEELLSRAQRKRDMEALQALGEALVALKPPQLRTLDLPDPLLQAILDAKTLHAHGGLRRQLQYIGQLMRHVDPAPIREYLDRLNGHSHAATAAMHRTERWRERMMEDVSLVDLFARDYPAVDRQHLRQQVLAAQRERILHKPPRHFRALFHTLAPFLEAVSPVSHEESDL